MAGSPCLTLLMQLRFQTGDRNLRREISAKRIGSRFPCCTPDPHKARNGRSQQSEQEHRMGTPSPLVCCCCYVVAFLFKPHMLAKRITKRFCAISLPCTSKRWLMHQ